MTILITGANGFIGRNLHEFLEKKEKQTFYKPKWINVSRNINSHIHYGCDLSNFTQVKEMMEVVKPETIVHLSGYSTSKPSPDDPSKIVRENIIATQNLLECMPEDTNFIFASSILVYGTSSRKEDDVCSPTSVYGMTKLAGENLLEAYKHKLGSYIALRLCATIGEKYMTHGMLYDFFKKAGQAVSQGQYFDVIGARPGAIKPFIHVDDVCQAIWTCLARLEYSGAYNLCPNDNISVEDVALRILYECADDNAKKRIRWNPNQVWRGDIQRISFDNSKFTQDFFPIQSSIDAVNKVVDNYEWSSK